MDVFDLLTTNGFQEVYNTKDDDEHQFDSFWVNCEKVNCETQKLLLEQLLSSQLR